MKSQFNYSFEKKKLLMRLIIHEILFEKIKKSFKNFLSLLRFNLTINEPWKKYILERKRKIRIQRK